MFQYQLYHRLVRNATSVIILTYLLDKDPEEFFIKLVKKQYSSQDSGT